MSLAVGQEFSLRIDRLAGGGDGVGRHDGQAVFVALAAPGDLLRVRVIRAQKRFAHAESLEVLEPGPDRREPSCEHFARCGGCDWMHLEPRAQHRSRIDAVRDALERIGGLKDLPEIDYLPSPVEFGYRSRARVAHAAGNVGYRASRSHEVVDVVTCPVLDEATQAELSRLRSDPPHERGERNIRGYGETLQVAGREYHVGRDAFFQTNAFLWDSWLHVVLGACGTGDLAVELYAGVGFYTAPLAERFARVIAVERGRHARDARRNTKAEIVEADAESWAASELAELRPDLVLLNPPRTGCAPGVCEAIIASGAQRIVYVSCEPSTLARDLKLLSEECLVTDVTCIDALPNTHHVEVVASLRQRR